MCARGCAYLPKLTGSSPPPEHFVDIQPDSGNIWRDLGNIPGDSDDDNENMLVLVNWIAFLICDAYWYSLTHWDDQITGVNGRRVTNRLDLIK